MVSIKEVARQAGVSPGTVSNTLHNPERVNKETRQRVMAAIQALNYRPDPSAQGIRRGKSGIIGAMLPHDYTEVISPLLMGAVNEAAQNRQTILISPPYDTPESEEAAFHNLLNKPIDALLYMPRNVDVRFDELDYFSSIPIVGLLRREMDMSIPSVYTDSQYAAYISTKYLLSLGCKKIAFMCGIGDYGDLSSAEKLFSLAHSPRAGLHVAADRLLGYEKALNEAHMELSTEMIFGSDLRISGGKKTARAILARNDIDGVLADSDAGAYGFISFVKEQGFSVPEDFCVIGFGDDSFAQLSVPGITTVSRNAQEMGRIAVKMVNRMLDGETEVSSHCITPQLVVRGSTRKRKEKSL